MRTNRREVLKGLSALTAAAAANLSISSVPAWAGAAAPELPWPKPIGSPVLDSLRPVIETSRDVRTHFDKIVEVAHWMAYEDLPMPTMAVPYGIDKDPAVAIDFIMVSNSINSAFTDFRNHVKFQTDYAGQHLSDSDAMVACLKRAMDEGIPVLDGKFLARITRS